MKGLDSGFIISGEKNIVRQIDGVTRWRNGDQRVCFMFLKPEGEVTTSLEELLGWIVFARYWEHIKERRSWTESTLSFSCVNDRCK